MKTFYHNDSKIIIFDDGKFAVAASEEDIEEIATTPSNFAVGVSCEKVLGIGQGEFEFLGCETFDEGIKLEYKDKCHGLEMTVALNFVPETNVFVQQNIVTNSSDSTIRITQLSSGALGNIACRGDKPWYENNSLTFNICYNKWQAEAQWQKFTPAQLGLAPATMHFWEKEIYDIRSTGSWSTASYYPLIIAEDSENKRVYFAEIEGSHSWDIKICSCGGYTKPMLYAELTACNEENGGWYYDLKPGESYTAQRAFFGTVKGGFEEAADELNRFKRRDSKIKPAKNMPYVVYNTYMNALWLDQTPEKLIPLIKAAANAGCEIFCIDAGWSQSKDGDTTDYLGDWYQREDIYGKDGLKKIADLIKDEGMMPGIWFEFDACISNVYGYSIDDNAVIKRYNDVVGGKRTFYNMKNQKVRAYLKDRVREIYNTGFRYIKNDYNKNTGIGCTNNYDGDSPAEGLKVNADAFYDFISELYNEFPGLIIENCGSGAMRSDNKMLGNFALQSTSDQELYRNYPSIMMGSMAIMPPEKAGIWSYPYPVTFYEKVDFELSEEYTAKMHDTEQTVFNMITAMFGCMYLSGRIDLCDQENFLAIKEGISLYKKNRQHVLSSHPVYPTGMHRLNQKECFAFGTISASKMVLAAWNLDSDDKELYVNLNKWLNKKSRITNIYPSASNVEGKLDDGGIEIKFKKKNTAVLYEISIDKI